jgi:putative ABC transport system permease protein
MLQLVLRGFLQRKLRVALTATAIVLGVALMAGTYILTDTINRSFAAIFQTASKGHDVVVSPAEQLGREVRAQTSPVTQAMLETVRRTPGVAEAAGSIFTNGTFLDTHRKRVTSGFAPAFIASTVPARFESFRPIAGSFPANSTQVAIDEATAERAGLHIGQQLIVAGSAATGRYTIVGVLRFGGGESFGGAGAALLIPQEAQRLIGEAGHYDQIDVAAAQDVAPGQLRDRIRRELPATVDVRTGTEQASHDTSNLEHNLGGLRTFLLIFAYVALVVGAFIIFNTFSITVAQRTREFALLRTLGASRAQILRLVVYEGLLLGVLGAGLGLLVGVGVAPALDALFKAFGATLPDSGTVLETRTIVVSLLVGVGVTVLAGLPPALRATRVPPVAAMREGVQIPPRPLPTRRALVIRFLAGLAIFGALVAVGAAGVGVVFAVVWTLRGIRLAVRLRRGEERPRRRYRVVPALGHAIGTLVRWRGITGRLAEENSIRQPGRTMATAAALTVGLALVAFVSVLAASFKATINQAVDRSFAGNLIVENSQSGNEQGIPPGVATAVRMVPGVAEVTAVAFTLGRPSGSKSNEAVSGVEPASFGKAYRLEWKHGSQATLTGLAGTEAIVTDGFAESRHLERQRVHAVDADRAPPAPDRRRGDQGKRRTARRRDDRPGARRQRIRAARRRRRLRHVCARRDRQAGAAAGQPAARRLLSPGPLAHGRSVQAGSGRPDKQPAHADLRAARAVGDRLAVRHRQHPDPLDLRAHARARDDASDRHQPPPGAPDDPLRVRDHRPDRGRARARARDHRRGDHIDRALRRRLRAGLARRHVDRPAVRRGAGWRAGRRAAGAPRGQARHAAGDLG